MLSPNPSPRRVRRGDGEKRCDIFVTQLGRNRGKDTNRKSRKAFIYFDSDPSEPLGVRGVGSSNLPVPTIVFPLLLRSFASSFFLASASHFPN
jgi:hypothetical protein